MLLCVCQFQPFHTPALVSLSSIQKQGYKLFNASLSFIPTPVALNCSVSCSSLPVLRSLLSLNVCLFILLPSLVCLWIVGYRAQLSADAGQRRPSQKEKYVRPRDYLSPLCHHTPDTPLLLPLNPDLPLDWMKVFAFSLHSGSIPANRGRTSHPIKRLSSA